MSRTIFYGPKDVRAIEVRLYIVIISSLEYKLYPVFRSTFAGINSIYFLWGNKKKKKKKKKKYFS